MKGRIQLLAAALCAVACLAGLSAPASAASPSPGTHKPAHATVGKQTKPQHDPANAKLHAQTMAPLGPTKQVAVKPNGAPQHTLRANAGYDSRADFTTPSNYCYQSSSYTYVKNNTAGTLYYEVQLYNNGTNRTFYSSVAANSYGYPYWEGLSGTYYAYLYVWNGSSYAYDEYESSSNTCSVSVTLSNWGYGYLALAVTNSGTDYASVDTDELAPNSAYGTYTGEHWLYPSPGGGTVTQYYYVRPAGLKYGIDATVYGSRYTTWHFAGTAP